MNNFTQELIGDKLDCQSRFSHSARSQNDDFKLAHPSLVLLHLG